MGIVIDGLQNIDLYVAAPYARGIVRIGDLSVRLDLTGQHATIEFLL